MKYLLIILSSILIFFSSCDNEKIVDIGEVPITANMVINGLIYADSDTNYLYITESSSIYNDTADYWNPTKFKIIKDVDVDLNNDIESIKYSEADTAYVVIKRIDARDKISITSNYNGKEIRSTVEVPDAPEIISIDTTHFKRIEGTILENYILFNLKIKDKPNNRDYYRLIVDNSAIRYYDDYKSSYSGSCYSDDPLLNGAFKTFRDVSFDGEEYNLTFYVSNYNYLFEEGSDIRNTWQLSVKLQKINEDLYKYYSSLQSNIGNNGFTESKFIYSNIDGGLGILGTCNEINIFEYRNDSHSRALKSQ